MKKIISSIGNLNILFGVILIVAPFIYIFAFVNFAPQVVASDGVTSETKTLLTSITGGSVVKQYKPSLTASQTTTNNYIKIPSVGIDTQIYEGDDSTLDKGVWLLPDHTTPDDRVSGEPVVLAAHRWGPDDASYEYRAKNLFYHLPSTSVGDQITITWNGKDYVYKIVAKSEGDYATQSADLILYTCKYYNSAIRIWAYAELVK